MNKSALYLAIFAVLCVLSGVLVGANITKHQKWPPREYQQADFKRKAQRMVGYESGRSSKDRRKRNPVETLSTKLGLSAEQKEKITKIFEEARQDIDNAGKDIRASIKQIKDKSDAKIMEVLDSVQQDKFKQLQEEIKRKIESGKARFQGDRQGKRLPPPED